MKQILDPSLDDLRLECVLMQAWKKTSAYLRTHSWYADTLGIDCQSLRVPAFLAEIQQAIDSYADWTPEPLEMVPAPKTQKWHLDKNGDWVPRSGDYPMVGAAEDLEGMQLDRTLWYQPDDPPFVPVGSRRFDPESSEEDLRGIYPGWDRFGRTKAQAWVDGVLTVHASEENVPNRPPIVLETYAYDKASNPISRYDSRPGAHLADRDFQFVYDDLDRLIGSVRGDDASNDWEARGTQEWTLDMLGNWAEFRWDKNGDEDFADASEKDIRDHNSANEISARTLDNPSPPDTSVPVTYDKVGNVRLRYETALLRMELTHDAWNRLVRVRRITGNIDDPPLDVSEHEYNGLHWRVVSRRDTDSPPDGEIDERRAIIYSGAWQVLEEFVESGFDPDDVGDPIAADYRMQQFWGLRHIDDAVMLRRQANVTGGEIERTSFQLTDRQFSVIAVLDETSALMERVTYDPYGRAQHRWPGDFNGDWYADSADTGGMALFSPIDDPGYKADEDLDRNGYTDIDDLIIAAGVWSGHGPLGSGQISDPEGPANQIGYAGYRFEPASSLYHVRFRWYDTGLGRWAERDPAGSIDGANTYEYVRSSVARSVDRYGLCEVDCEQLENNLEKAKRLIAIGKEACGTDMWEEDVIDLAGRYGGAAADIASTVGDELLSNVATGANAATMDLNRSGLRAAATRAGAVGTASSVAARGLFVAGTAMEILETREHIENGETAYAAINTATAAGTTVLSYTLPPAAIALESIEAGLDVWVKQKEAAALEAVNPENAERCHWAKEARRLYLGRADSALQEIDRSNWSSKGVHPCPNVLNWFSQNRGYW